MPDRQSLDTATAKIMAEHGPGPRRERTRQIYDEAERRDDFSFGKMLALGIGVPTALVALGMVIALLLT